MLEGLLITLELSLYSILLSFFFGILIGVLRYAKIPVISQALYVWVEVIRNLPLLLIIFFTFFALPEVTGWDPTPLQAGVFALTLFESALISEIVRGGLNSIPKGQTEASRSSGLTYVQTLRFILVPQALRKMIPPIVSQFISLIKDTSLVTIISLEEFLRASQIVFNQNPNWVFPILLLTALVYFAVNYSLSIAAGRLERRLRT